MNESEVIKNLNSEILRTIPCNKCSHSTSERNIKKGQNDVRYKESYCDVFKVWLKMITSYKCPYFEDMRIDDDIRYINGYSIRNERKEDFRTQKQWEKAGFLVKPNEKGQEMYASYSAFKKDPDNRIIYYLPEQVERRTS